jgi:uncharacterized protein (TIGR03083 family)
VIPTHSIDQLAETWASISALGAGLTEEQWKTATDLPGWTVQDNISHLIGTERVLQKLPRTEHNCDPGPHVHNAIGKLNEDEVDGRRGCTGAEVFREFEDLVALRLATLRGADEAYFAEPMMTPVGHADMATFLQLRVLDNWLHEQDIRRALDRPGNLDSAAAGHTVDRLLRTVPLVVGKRAAAPDGAAVVLEITGGVPRHVVTEVHDGRAAVVREATATPLATIRMDTETFVVLAAGRREYADVAERVTIDGDQDLGLRVLTQMNMMI